MEGNNRDREDYLTHLYLGYLESLIGGGEGYKNLINGLFKREFYSPLERDSNRAAYGLLLRKQFLDIYGFDNSDLNFLGPCSVLEMMIALADGIDTYGSIDMLPIERTTRYFWMMVCNLGLDGLVDANWNYTSEGYFNHVIDVLLDRKYAANGSGGLFPLQKPMADQRDVEIWFQMQSYFLEKNCDIFATDLE
jgi:hypothetical protein